MLFQIYLKYDLMPLMNDFPKAIRLTERAAVRVREVMAQASEPFVGVRLGLKNGGCAGVEYIMEYAHAPETHDEIVEDKGVKIFIDAKAILFLFGTEMDYEEGRLASGFRFNNPNQTDACGCGESVTLKSVALS